MYNPYIFRNYSPGEEVPEINSFFKSNPEGVDLIKDIVSKPEEEQAVVPDIVIEEPDSKPPVKNEKSPINSSNFKSKMMGTYKKVLKDMGLDGDYARYLVAQDALESNWGKSSLSEVNNFGGIKAVGNSPYVEKWTTEHINGKKERVKAKFRKFDNLEDYARYKVNLLNNKRYMAFNGNKEGFFDRVKRGGYATDVDYVNKLNRVLASMKRGGIVSARDGKKLQETAGRAKQWVKDNVIANTEYGPIDRIAEWAFGVGDRKDVSDVPFYLGSPDMISYGSTAPDRSNVVLLGEEDFPTAVHEATHVAKRSEGIAANQIAAIRDEMRRNGKSIFSDDKDTMMGGPDYKYLDSPEEIHARVNALRAREGWPVKWDPGERVLDSLKMRDKIGETHYITKKDKDGNVTGSLIINFDKYGNKTSEQDTGKLEKDGSIDFDYDIMYHPNNFNTVDRYNTEFLRKVLKDVASAKKDDKGVKSSKLGGLIPSIDDLIK